MTTQQLINYYANLLILQYIGKPKAYATIQKLVTPVLLPQTTVQTITFSGIAASGTFKLNYGLLVTAAINWNDSVATIQGKIQALTGLASVTVAGSIASKLLTVTFTGVAPAALALVVSNNSLQTVAPLAITLTVLEVDEILPLAIQDAFNLNGSSTAVGSQLDILGKYAGVIRTGYTLSGLPITLTDSEFLIFIKLAIVSNSNTSDLAAIQTVLHDFFPNEILVFDHQQMRMSYLIDSSIGDQNLISLFIKEGLLPKPMGVQLSTTIYTHPLKFFGMLDALAVKNYSVQNSVSITVAANAAAVAENISPFNDATAPITGVWLNAQSGVVI